MHTQIIQNLLQNLVFFHNEHHRSEQPKIRCLAIFSIYVANLLRQIKHERDQVIAANCSKPALDKIMALSECVAQQVVEPVLIEAPSAAAASIATVTDKAQRTYRTPGNYEQYLSESELEKIHQTWWYQYLTGQISQWLHYNLSRLNQLQWEFGSEGGPFLQSIVQLIRLLTETLRVSLPVTTTDLSFLAHYRTLAPATQKWIDLDRDISLNRVFVEWIEQDRAAIQASRIGKEKKADADADAELAGLLQDTALDPAPPKRPVKPPKRVSFLLPTDGSSAPKLERRHIACHLAEMVLAGDSAYEAPSF